MIPISILESYAKDYSSIIMSQESPPSKSRAIR